ncbi:MAG: alpha/beta hydrolase family protein, partial [Pseudomonadales bacterium]|nr:alpha/beta hydrolase family protein [Pseudomonadales bacterium]
NGFNNDVEKAPPRELRKPPVRAELTANKALAQELKLFGLSDSEILWLGEGKDQYLGLLTPDFSGSPVGNVLILHDNQQHPDWPGTVHALRTELPKNGWSTLSISVPYFDVKVPIPKREEKPATMRKSAPTLEANDKMDPVDQNEGESGNESTEAPAASPPKNTMESASEAIEARANQPPTEQIKDNELPSVEYPKEEIPNIVEQRIRDGISTLQEQNTLPTIVIAVGLSATWAINKISKMQPSDIKGLVIIDPVPPPGIDGFDVDKDIVNLKIPTLDITPIAAQRSSASQRSRTMKKIGSRLYQQRVIAGSAPNFGQQHHQVISSVRGWWKRYFSLSF